MLLIAPASPASLPRSRPPLPDDFGTTASKGPMQVALHQGHARPSSMTAQLQQQCCTVASPQTQPTTGQFQMASPSAGSMLASWYSAWSTTLSCNSCGPALRQNMGQSLAPFTLPSLFSMSLTCTGTPTSLLTSAMCAIKSAYDKVQGHLLWGLLQRLGVHGHMLGAVQSLYDGSLLSMQVGGHHWSV